ncbi:CdiA family toxin C-terminal domain-containing protein [Pseudomonas cichorii]|nr:CdiA family toxin C-terminal domain-containing protein [Pseudomonas cichorii]
MKDAIKTVYDQKFYPDMANMDNEAAYKTLIQYQLTGDSLQEVVVGKVRFQVAINVGGKQVYVSTDFPVGVVKWVARLYLI